MWGVIAGTVREWMATSPSRLVLMRRIGGCVMITLGIFTLTSAL
jgi:threonine/homoserine/homoserine lactone efflux protein